MEHFSDKLIEKLENNPSRQRQRHFKPGWRDKRRHDVDYNRSNNWIRSKIGQHFDKVFSAWCDLEWVPIDRRNMEGIEMHIERVIPVNGILYAQSYCGDLCKNWHGIYVHPKTKIISLKKDVRGISYKERQRREMLKYCRILDDYHQIFKIDGIWYDVKTAPTYTHVEYKWVDGPPEIVLATFGKNEYITRPGPKVHKRFVTVRASRKRVLFNRIDSRYCGKVTRRQLNKAELKAYGVTNDPVQYHGEPI